jgi:hypothetical protein
MVVVVVADVVPAMAAIGCTESKHRHNRHRGDCALCDARHVMTFQGNTQIVPSNPLKFL